jgi:hypothetical protein
MLLGVNGMTMRDIASVVVEYLSTLSNGTGISTSEAIDKIFGIEYLAGGNYRISDKVISCTEFFDLNDTVHNIAKQKGVILDTSHNAGIPIGLPFHVPYVVSRADSCTVEYIPHFIFQKDGRHTMTWFHLTEVVYSREHGDSTLPKLADMVSKTPDPYKDLILDYLGEHCIAGCPGVRHDAVNPNEVIGSGHLYSDDKYFWDDCFANYVRKYNIPVPSEFRSHILENYKVRKLRHARHRLIKSVRITNNPCFGYRYVVSIDQNGTVLYSNSQNGSEETRFTIVPEDADYIVHPITESMFCYGDEPNGEPIIGGYHWEIEFYNAKGLAYKMEGWPGEPKWRYEEFRNLVAFLERELGKELGSGYLRRESSD